MNIVNEKGKYFFYNELNIINKLEPKNYIFKFDRDFSKCWLEDADDFTIPDKIYDVNNEMRKFIRLSYLKENSNLGILLTGNKGQGKSMTAKQICMEMNLPVIIIGSPIPRFIDFIEFLNKIKQNYVLFVDEFEKLFKERPSHNGGDKDSEDHTQESFLSFMDGSLTNTNKIVFLLTTNEPVNSYFINRPSRIKFLYEYNELSEELFDAIVDDLLENKDYKEDLENNISLVNINIDLLISIVKDINLYKKPFSEFAKYYNYVFESYRYEVSVTRKGGKESFDSFFTTDKKINYNTRYIGGYDVSNMIKFSRQEIVFESSEYNEKTKREDKLIVKVNPVKALSVSRLVI
ncbi:MAG: AAA family ATPase [Richelia sp. RM2_1_2]|nr:AAA family ATPase [Richelia sp. RM2_1_2]